MLHYRIHFTHIKSALVQVIAVRREAITWANADPIYLRIYAALGRDELIVQPKAIYVRYSELMNIANQLEIFIDNHLQICLTAQYALCA